MLDFIPVQLLVDMGLFMAAFAGFAILLWQRNRKSKN